MKKISEKKAFAIKLVLSLLVIGAVVLCAYFLLKELGIYNLTSEKVRDIIAETGVVAPLVFILVTFLQVTFVPIPSTVTILAGNYLFGFLGSFIYSYIGLIIGSVVAFYLGRLIGKPFIYWLVGSKEKAESWLKRLKGRENVFLFFAFLFPAFPDDFLCSVAGVTPMKFITFLIMQLVTRVISIGGNLVFLSGTFIPYDKPWGISVIVVLVIIALIAFILSMKHADKLNEFFDKFVNKFKLKGKNDGKNQ